MMTGKEEQIGTDGKGKGYKGKGKGKSIKGACWTCNEIGHRAEDCPKKKTDLGPVWGPTSWFYSAAATVARQQPCWDCLDRWT